MNRRTAPRTKVDLLVNRFLNGQPYLCRVTDLSETGLRLRPILEPIGEHRFMGLQFQLPGSAAIVTASAEAIDRVDAGDGIGVRFTKLGVDSESALRRFVAAN